MEAQEGEIAGLTEDRRWNWDRTPGLCEPLISSLSISVSPHGAWGGKRGTPGIEDQSCVSHREMVLCCATGRRRVRAIPQLSFKKLS